MPVSARMLNWPTHLSSLKDLNVNVCLRRTLIMYGVGWFSSFFFAHTRGKPQDTHPCQKPKQKKDAEEAEEKKNKVT